MSQDGAIMLDFAGSQYLFRLAIGQWQKLEAEFAMGPAKIYERMHSREWTSADVQKVIKWGLIGGGIPPHHAAEMVRDYVDPLPLEQSWQLARNILQVGWHGSPLEDDNPSKKENPPERSLEKESMTFPVGDIDGAHFTEPVAH
jgi:hypothetical protein